MTRGGSPLDGAVALVTGASGFIGAKLCRALIARGMTVHGAGRRAAPELETPSLEYHAVDLGDDVAARKLVGSVRPDLVFHLASHVYGAPDLEHVLPTFRSNLQTTVNLLVASVESGGPRVILTGSLVEPEGGSDRVPSAPYAAAKWASSDYARMFYALYGLPVSIARVFMVYGPEQQDRTKLVPYTIRCLARSERPEIASGRRLIDWVYVDDVVEGLVAIASTSDIGGQMIDLGSGELISTAELVETIRSLMGASVKPRLGAIADRPLEPVRAARTARTRELVGWEAQTPLREGLARTIDWFTSAEGRAGHG